MDYNPKAQLPTEQLVVDFECMHGIKEEEEQVFFRKKIVAKPVSLL